MKDVFGKQDITSRSRIQAISIRGQWPWAGPLPHDIARPFTLTFACVALAASLWTGSASAAGSRAAVDAKPGEIVLLRSVPARPAARSMPPGRALLVDPSPKSEMEQGLSHLEISPGSYGQVAAGGGNGPVASGGMGGSINSITQQLVGGSAQRGDSAPSAAGGAIGSATGSIGSTVTGALSGAGLLGQGGQR